MNEMLELPIKSLKAYKKNSRKHSPEQIKTVMRSIEKFGFTNPVLIWGEKNEIIAGHARVQAAEALGLDEVPCIRLDYLTDEERRAYIIADNKIHEGSTWDAEILLEELTSLAEADFDISFTGFDMDFLADGILEANPIEDGARDYENDDHEIIGDDDRDIHKPERETREAEGAIEYSADDFDEFKHQCPRCGFEFDKGMAVKKDNENGSSSEDGTLEVDGSSNGAEERT